MSVDDVMFRTQLPRSVLMALEAEDFSVFTSPLYAKSFLAQYSEFLGVDARLWLDALEPDGFMPGGLLQPIVKGLDVPFAVKSAGPEIRGGWRSVLGLLAMSAMLVLGVVKSYEFFEARFGGDPSPRTETAIPAPPPPPAVIPEKPKEWIPAIVKEDEELGKPAPRAIIVR